MVLEVSAAALSLLSLRLHGPGKSSLCIVLRLLLSHLLKKYVPKGLFKHQHPSSTAGSNIPEAGEQHSMMNINRVESGLLLK